VVQPTAFALPGHFGEEVSSRGKRARRARRDALRHLHCDHKDVPACAPAAG